MKDRTVDGGKLRSLRLTALLRQRELAEQVGVHSTTICHIETDKWEASDLLAHKIAAALNCTVEDFTHAKADTKAVA
jgi:DNA-binding XRE family transcriptional regulator